MQVPDFLISSDADNEFRCNTGFVYRAFEVCGTCYTFVA